MNIKKVLLTTTLNLFLIASAVQADTPWQTSVPVEDLSALSYLDYNLSLTDPDSNRGTNNGLHRGFEIAQATHGFDVNNVDNAPGLPPVVPEPMSYLLFAAGGTLLAGVTFLRKMKKAKA